MSFQIAEVLAQQGRKDDAIAALEKAWDVRDGGLTSLRQDDMLAPLHGDPRFEAIVKRMNFPS